MTQNWRIAIAGRLLGAGGCSSEPFEQPDPSEVAMKRDRLAQRRKAVGLSQERLAEKIGVDRSTVVRWEGARTDPQPWHRPRLAEALDISIEELAALLADAPQQAGDSSQTSNGRRWPLDVESKEPVVSRFGLGTGAGSEMADTDNISDADQRSEILRRDVLTRSIGITGAVATVPLIKILLTQGGAIDTQQPPGLPGLRLAVLEAKTAYQNSRYDNTLERLAALLPALDTARRDADSGSRAALDALASDAYHVAGGVLLKVSDHPMALIAAERSVQHAAASSDPIAAGTSARIMTHALMRAGHTARAVDFAQDVAQAMEQTTRLNDSASLAVYGALVLRAAIAAARVDDRAVAGSLMEAADGAAQKLGRDGNDRLTGFGRTNVSQHRVTVALALGDAGTAIALARQISVDQIRLAERKACLYLDVAQAYAQWGRREQALTALQTAYEIAPEEIRSRPTVHRIVGELAALSRGHLWRQVTEFAAAAGVQL